MLITGDDLEQLELMHVARGKTKGDNCIFFKMIKKKFIIFRMSQLSSV